jgi:hypothetical protein
MPGQQPQEQLFLDYETVNTAPVWVTCRLVPARADPTLRCRVRSCSLPDQSLLRRASALFLLIPARAFVTAILIATVEAFQISVVTLFILIRCLVATLAGFRLARRAAAVC